MKTQLNSEIQDGISIRYRSEIDTIQVLKNGNWVDLSSDIFDATGWYARDTTPSNWISNGNITFSKSGNSVVFMKPIPNGTPVGEYSMNYSGYINAKKLKTFICTGVSSHTTNYGIVYISKDNINWIQVANGLSLNGSYDISSFDYLYIKVSIYKTNTGDTSLIFSTLEAV